MNILIIVPTFRPNIGGVESYLDDLCDHLVKKEHNVHVVTYQPLTTRARGLKFEKNGRLEIHRITWFGHNWFHKLEPYPVLEFLYLTPWLFMHTFFFMMKNHRKINCLHAQGLNAAFIARFLAKIFKKRAVMSTCAVYNFKQGSLFARVTRWTLHGFDKILALADFSKRELVSIGVPSDKIATYYLWIDQEAYRPADKEKTKGDLGFQGRFMVLFVGRFIKIKGVEILLETAKKSIVDAYFYFIGDNGPLLETVEKATQEFKNIILVKEIRGRQLIPYYQAADLLVVPSQYEEAFGKVIIEALSCGTPVIGAHKGAIPDILKPSVGRVVEPTVASIKREVEFFFNKPDALRRLTEGCRQYALGSFSSKNAEIIEKSYLPG
jgi:glycosyltransferase involved in cell wall biosynthesis